MQESTVSSAHSGMKLGTYLHHVLDISSTQIKSAKWENRILVNGTPKFVSFTLCEGDRVTFLDSEIVPVYSVTPSDIPINVVYIDDYLMIIDKPARIATSSSIRYPHDALENAVFSYLGCPDGFIFRPINRLDKGTSGLMCVARDPYTQCTLQSLLHTAAFARSYLAVTDGIPEQPKGTIDLPIGKKEGPTIQREIRQDGKPSITHYEVLCENNSRSLIRLKLETGRTHQIRVHLSSIGCPVFGDFLYGKESDMLPGRFALHSESLTLIHPKTHESMTFSSDLPSELRHLLD
ncbi:MAG: RluA family pseudouridine synthase [Clostridia bacterium]|nr:RluA family pseudouridine synthase [Clostridia bacterium]